MKFLDHILLNRSIAIITSFILGLLKLIAPSKKDINIPQPPIRKRRLRKKT